MGNFELHGWTFAQAPIQLLFDERISPQHVVVYIYLAWRQGTDAGCWPSQARMAKDLHRSRETISRIIGDLEATGWITVTRTEGKGNYYCINAEPVTKTSQGSDENVTGTSDENVTHDDNHGDDNHGRKRAKSGRAPTPPAVKTFREAAHRYPSKSWYQEIDETVGTSEDDLAFWQQVVYQYVGQGWNPTNVANMLQFFRERKIPGKSDAEQPLGTNRPTPWEQAGWTEEEYEARMGEGAVARWKAFQKQQAAARVGYSVRNPNST